ncbi:uncharacterized protein (DUF2235 family) [Bradyrhizobium sp. LM4.3]
MPHQDGAPNADPVGPEHAHIETHAGGTTTAIPPKRKLVLFADGTGNAFTTQESSVWRLYEALDHTQPDQIAYYIKGVGTAGWAPLAALDGATGIGVPGNVRKLYRFLCWNWREGDEIYIFGFSRGAFTARTLASLIASQGLVPAEIGGTPVSHEEMERNAMAAWREYRRDTVPLKKSLPTIWIARFIRDVLLYLYHAICRHRSYADVRSAMNGRKEIDIEFLGLFDTVEAFGVPIEELRVAIDWAIWPISFRNHRPSRKVKHISHALALDDERTTFHPLRIDQSHLAPDQTVEEVWFTGVHSDIGGGYPESTLSFVPLVWMADQLDGRLRFQDGEIEHFRKYQSATGPKHDSRSGAAVLYRYGPRPILAGQVNGGLPVVHFAVIERMLFGCDDYAPIMLPADALVLTPDSSKLNLVEDGTREAMKQAYLAKAQDPRRETEAEAFTRMNTPSAEMARLTRDTVWWRRVAYFSLLFMVGVIAVWPWIARSLIGVSKDNGLQGTMVLHAIATIDWLVGAVLGPLANLVRNVLPSYAAPWLDITLYYPFATSIVLVITYLIWRRNTVLRDTIQERARLAWSRPHRMASQRHLDEPGLLLRFARMDAAECGTGAPSLHQARAARHLSVHHLLLGPAHWGDQRLHRPHRDRKYLHDSGVRGRHAGARRTDPCARPLRDEGVLLVERPFGRERPLIPRLGRDRGSLVRPDHLERHKWLQDLFHGSLPRPADAPSVRRRLVPARRARRYEGNERRSAEGRLRHAGRRIAAPDESDHSGRGRCGSDQRQVSDPARQDERVRGTSRRRSVQALSAQARALRAGAE